MRSAVRLAAWMPATRATLRTSPLLTALEAIIAVVSGFMNTLQRAMARRWVGSLGVTSTMRARPSGSRWVKPLSDMERGYPPIWLMLLDGLMKWTWPIEWPAHLVP